MATMLNCIEDITSWLNEIFKNIKLKKQSEKQGNYELTNPVAFSMYMPLQQVSENNNNSIQCPSATVQLYDSIDNLKEHTGNLTILIHTAIWNPGTHETETKIENNSNLPYIRNSDGWKDAVVFCDFIVEELKKAGSINGHRILYENGIKCYPYKEQNTIVDFYPYYFMEIEFAIEKSFATQPKPYNEILY